MIEWGKNVTYSLPTALWGAGYFTGRMVESHPNDPFWLVFLVCLIIAFPFFLGLGFVGMVVLDVVGIFCQLLWLNRPWRS